MTHVWTERELDALRRHYPTHGAKWEGWADWLPGRTANAINIKASQCGVRFDGQREKADSGDAHALGMARLAVGALDGDQRARLYELVANAEGREHEAGMEVDA